MEYDVLFDSESFSVSVPNYLSSVVYDSSENGEDENENGESAEYSEDPGVTSSFTLDDVYSNQVIIIDEIRNLNNNVCIMNDNLIILNDHLMYLIGVSALALFFTLVNFAIRIFNNTLGLGKV